MTSNKVYVAYSGIPNIFIREGKLFISISSDMKKFHEEYKESNVKKYLHFHRSDLPTNDIISTVIKTGKGETEMMAVLIDLNLKNLKYLGIYQIIKLYFYLYGTELKISRIVSN